VDNFPVKIFRPSLDWWPTAFFSLEKHIFNSALSQQNKHVGFESIVTKRIAFLDSLSQKNQTSYFLWYRVKWPNVGQSPFLGQSEFRVFEYIYTTCTIRFLNVSMLYTSPVSAPFDICSAFKFFHIFLLAKFCGFLRCFPALAEGFWFLRFHFHK